MPQNIRISENKFEDEEFDIYAPENADVQVGRLKEDAQFINDGLDATDVAQGQGSTDGLVPIGPIELDQLNWSEI